MRIVCDTNIFISSLIFGGNPERIIKFCERRKIHLIISPAILREVERILREHFDWIKSDIDREIRTIINISEVFEPKSKLDVVRNDKTDNKILECAVEGKVDYIVSGDKKHLLSLKKYRDIKILSPQDFLKVLYAKEK